MEVKGKKIGFVLTGSFCTFSKTIPKMKELIKKELSNKIIAFKTAEAKYLEAKSYGNYHPDLKEYQRKFTVAKTNLYSEAYVKEYIQLERKIQSSLNADFNDLKKSISNKFKLNQF